MLHKNWMAFRESRKNALRVITMFFLENYNKIKPITNDQRDFIFFPSLFFSFFFPQISMKFFLAFLQSLPENSNYSYNFVTHNVRRCHLTIQNTNALEIILNKQTTLTKFSFSFRNLTHFYDRINHAKEITFVLRISQDKVKVVRKAWWIEGCREEKQSLRLACD